MIEPRLEQFLGDKSWVKTLGQPLSKGTKDLATWQRLLIKWFLVILTVIVGASLQSFNTFANFGGALLLPAIAFVYPPMLYLKVAKADSRDPTWYKWLCVASVLLGVFMLVAGVYVSVKSLKSGNHSNGTNISSASAGGGSSDSPYEGTFGPAQMW